MSDPSHDAFGNEVPSASEWFAGAHSLTDQLREKDALIERLKKELKEARDFNNELHNALGHAVVSMRKRTIEECATRIGELCGTEGMAAKLIEAIRSIDGGGK